MAARISRCQDATRSQNLLWWDFRGSYEGIGYARNGTGQTVPKLCSTSLGQGSSTSLSLEVDGNACASTQGLAHTLTRKSAMLLSHNFSCGHLEPSKIPSEGWFIRTLCYKQTPELRWGIEFCALGKTEKMDEPIQMVAILPVFQLRIPSTEAVKIRLSNVFTVLLLRRNVQTPRRNRFE